MKTRTKNLVYCAMMLALAFVLSFVKIFQLPLGGAVTLFSMVPLCIVSIRLGLGWGLGTAFCYSLLQILQGGVFNWGLSPVMLIGSLAFDFIVAFTSLGLAGVFRRFGKKGAYLGTLLACILRFLSHFTAGVILWANLDKFAAFGRTFEGRPVLYSLLYNGAYMLGEIVITMLATALLLNIPQIRQLILPEKRK